MCGSTKYTGPTCFTLRCTIGNSTKENNLLGVKLMMVLIFSRYDFVWGAEVGFSVWFKMILKHTGKRSFAFITNILPSLLYLLLFFMYTKDNVSHYFVHVCGTCIMYIIFVGFENRGERNTETDLYARWLVLLWLICDLSRKSRKFVLVDMQCISQDLEIGRPNLLFFEKLGVQMFDLKYICLCVTNKTGCPFSKQGVQKTPKGIAS